MLDMIVRWIARLAGTPAPGPAPPGADGPSPRTGPISMAIPVLARSRVEFPTFYAYLEKRYADMVVLSFGQIEDLLAAKLPDAARTSADWWTEITPATTRYADAWRLAGRTARPNILARNVAFERIGPPAHVAPAAPVPLPAPHTA